MNRAMVQVAVAQPSPPPNIIPLKVEMTSIPSPWILNPAIDLMFCCGGLLWLFFLFHNVVPLLPGDQIGLLLLVSVAGTHIPCVLTIDGLTCTNAARARDCTITLEYDTWIDEYDCAVIVAGKSLPLPGCPEVRFNESETPSGTMVHRSDQSRPGSGFCRRIDRRTDGALGDRGAARRFVARGSACKPRRRSNEIERLGRRTLLAASRCATERPPTLRSIGWRTRGECRAGVGS